jgi:hypothetical protein
MPVILGRLRQEDGATQEYPVSKNPKQQKGKKEGKEKEMKGERKEKQRNEKERKEKERNLMALRSRQKNSFWDRNELGRGSGVTTAKKG